MVFSIIILLIALVITYMHYLQGAFTAAISLGCAFMAALLAFGYYENAVNAVGSSKFGDLVGGTVLIVLFAVCYTVLRVIFDSSIPGNIALPLYVERVGAAIFGFMAAVIAAGVLAVGAQLLPFGPSVGGYAKYELKDRIVIVPQVASGKRNAADSNIFDELAPEALDPASSSNLLLPVDNMVLKFITLSSDGGYAGGQSFGGVHPDLPTEAFAARLGADHSGNRVLLNTSKSKGAEVSGLFTMSGGVTGLDSELTDLRPNKQALVFKPSSSNGLVVIRVSFADAATDKDGFVRITPAAVRLTMNGVDYHPIGTMDGASKIGLNRLDDQVAVPMLGAVRAVDFVFELPKATADDLVKAGPASKTAFVEAKLFGRMNLSGLAIAPYSGPGATVGVVRKPSAPLGGGVVVPRT